MVGKYTQVSLVYLEINIPFLRKYHFSHVFFIEMGGGHFFLPKTGFQLFMCSVLAFSFSFLFSTVLPLLPDLLLWKNSHKLPNLASSFRYRAPKQISPK